MPAYVRQPCVFARVDDIDIDTVISCKMGKQIESVEWLTGLFASTSNVHVQQPQAYTSLSFHSFLKPTQETPMSGGFIVPTETSTLTSASSSRDPAAKAEADTKPSIPGTDAQPLLRLTPRQEGRLRIHVDGKLGELERDNKTR